MKVWIEAGMGMGPDPPAGLLRYRNPRSEPVGDLAGQRDRCRQGRVDVLGLQVEDEVALAHPELRGADAVLVAGRRGEGTVAEIGDLGDRAAGRAELRADPREVLLGALQGVRP